MWAAATRCDGTNVTQGVPSLRASCCDRARWLRKGFHPLDAHCCGQARRLRKGSLHAIRFDAMVTQEALSVGCSGLLSGAVRVQCVGSVAAGCGASTLNALCCDQL